MSGNNIEDRFPLCPVGTAFIYIAVGHLFAAFIYLLFSVGAK
ncbi:DUF6126 family protein [Streptomyces sp. L7]